MSACGGYASVASKIFMELSHLFDWGGPASGMPTSVDQVSVCLPTLTQVGRGVVGSGAVWVGG